MQRAEIADQTTIATLKIEQTHLISSLKNKHESVEKKIIRIGEIIEERFNRHDESLAKEGILIYNINQISGVLSKIFAKAGLKIAPWVHDYCYPRWKDPTKQHGRNNLLDESAATPRELDQLIGLSNRERDVLNQVEEMETSDMDPLYVFCKKFIQKMETVATSRNILLSGHEHKDPKETPKTDPEITEEWEAIQWFRDVACKQYQDYVKAFPGPPDKRRFWASGWQEFGLLLLDTKNLKNSLTRTEWCSRVQYMLHQSKHGAAVLDEVETMICDECWDDETGKEKPDCNAEMEWDETSITYYRCPTCGGQKGKLRGLTREQCGDNKAPTLLIAQRLINNLPGFYESILHKRKTEVDKRVYGRKIQLSETLRKKA